MTTHYSSISTVYAYNIIIQLFEIFQPFVSQEICQGFILPLSAATTTDKRFRSHAVVTSTRGIGHAPRGRVYNFANDLVPSRKRFSSSVRPFVRSRSFSFVWLAGSDWKSI